MTTAVLINELANLPHHDGQLVLQARREDFDVEIRCQAGTYYVYAFVTQPNGGRWTRLAAPRSTPHAARDLAVRAWVEGRDFDTAGAEERRPGASR